MGIHLRATECHLLLDTSELTQPLPWLQSNSDMPVYTPFTYHAAMEGWVDLGVGYIPRGFTCSHIRCPFR